jgi:hypothetical protein
MVVVVFMVVMILVVAALFPLLSIGCGEVVKWLAATGLSMRAG